MHRLTDRKKLFILLFILFLIYLSPILVAILDTKSYLYIFFHDFALRVFSSKDIMWVALGGYLVAVGITASILWPIVDMKENDIKKTEEKIERIKWGLKYELKKNFEKIFRPDGNLKAETHFYDILKDNMNMSSNSNSIDEIFDLYNISFQFNSSLEKGDDLKSIMANRKYLSNYIYNKDKEGNSEIKESIRLIEFSNKSRFFPLSFPEITDNNGQFVGPIHYFDAIYKPNVKKIEVYINTLVDRLF